MTDINVSHVVRLYTLLLLKEGPRHGYAVMKEIESMTGTEPTASHIYPFLGELEDNGLVEAEEEGSRGKKVYSLTEEGEDFVADQIGSFGRLLEAAIEGGVQECAHCDCKIYEDGYEADGETYCCEHCAQAAAE